MTMETELRTHLHRAGAAIAAPAMTADMIADRAVRRRRRRWALGGLAVVLLLGLGGLTLTLITDLGDSGNQGSTRIETADQDGLPSQPPDSPEPSADVADDDPGEGASDGDTDAAPAVDPVAVAEELARLTEASTVTQSKNLRPAGSLDIPIREILFWNDGVATMIELEPSWSLWADRNFVYSSVPVNDEEDSLRDFLIYSHDGALVCRARLDTIDTWLHHATRRADGSIVLGLAQGVEDATGSYREQAWAQSCDTGERTAIEPFSRIGGDGETESDTSIGGRTFTLSGDAEGNIWRIVDDAGRSLLTDDDYAGIITFSTTGSTIAYGEHRGAASHFTTNQVEVRDTITGELRLAWTAPDQIGGLHLVGDQILAVESGPYDSTFRLTEPTLVTVLHIDSGEQLGEVALGGIDLLLLD